MGVNRAANRVHIEAAQRRRRNGDFAQKELLLVEENHKIPFPKKFSFFLIVAGRTFAGADASRMNIGDFIAFFFNRRPSSCRVLLASRLRETARRARKRTQFMADAGSMT